MKSPRSSVQPVTLPDAEPINWSVYFSLVSVAAIGPMALNMFMPSVPGLTADLQTTGAMAQLTLTVYLLGTAFSQLVYGPLSDQFGRRPVLIAGISVFIIASVMCAMASSIEFLIGARLLQSFGGSAGMVLTRAMIRDKHDEKSSASVLGYVTMAWAVAPLISPTIGGYLDQASGWRMTFWVLAAGGVFALLLAYINLPETNVDRSQTTKRSRFANYKLLLKNRKFMWLSTTMAFTSGVFFSFLGGAPFLMIDVLHRLPLDYGAWFSVVALGYMVGNFLSGKLSRRTDTNKMIAAGIVLTMIAAVFPLIWALNDSLTPLLLFLPTSIIALGAGITIPSATAATLSTDPKAIGSAAGLAGFIQSIAGAGAAQVVGVMQVGMPYVSLWFMVLSSVGAAVSFLMVLKQPSSR